MGNHALTVNPSKDYTLPEIVEAEFIPFVRSYPKAYSLVTQKEVDVAGKNKAGYTRVKRLQDVTTATTLKAKHIGDPTCKISGKIVVEGLEIIKFLKIHKLI